MTVTVFQSITAKKPTYHHALQVLDRIKSGGPLEGVIAEIRESDKEARDKLKKRLPVICWGGKFSERKKSGLIKASGLLILDFDSGNVTSLREQFKKRPFTFACFSGPSGKDVSLKVILRIPVVQNDEEYKVYFNFFESRLPDLDTSGKDISRCCFYSYDPDCYINPNAQEFQLPKGYKETMSNPQERLRLICDKILTAPQGTSHMELLKQTYTAAGLCATGVFNRDVVIRALEDAADIRRPKEMADSRAAIKSAFEAGLQRPLYDDESISQAVSTFTRRPSSQNVNVPKKVNGSSLLVSRQTIEELSAKYNEGSMTKARSLGLPYLDDYLVFRDNSFVTVTGGKGSGKTTTLLYLFTLDAFVHGTKMLMSLFENDPWEAEQEVVGFLTGSNAKWLYGKDRARYSRAADFFHEHFTVMKVPPDYTIFDIFEAASQINSQSKYDRLFIDPLFKIAETDDYSKNKKIAAHAQPFAQDQMSLWVSMHPVGRVQREGTQPKDLDAEYGAMYSNAADVTMTISRNYKSADEEERSTVNLTIDKMRSRKIYGGHETFKDSPIKFQYLWKKNGYNIWVPEIGCPERYQRIDNVFSHLKRKQ